MAPAFRRVVLSDNTLLYRSQYPVMLICKSHITKVTHRDHQ